MLRKQVNARCVLEGGIRKEGAVSRRNPEGPCRKREQYYPRLMTNVALPSKQTRDADPMLVYCWASVEDAGPTLNQRWVNISCWLNVAQTIYIYKLGLDPFLLLTQCWANVGGAAS